MDIDISRSGSWFSMHERSNRAETKISIIQDGNFRLKSFSNYNGMRIEKQADPPRVGTVDVEGEGPIGEVPFELRTKGCYNNSPGIESGKGYSRAIT